MADIVHDIGASSRPRDELIARLATRQHGVVARRQLTELGMGRGAIGHRLSAGRLHRVHLGVYAVGHPRLAANGRAMAAVLACGQKATLSHRSAARLWGFWRSARALIDVTVPGGGRRGCPGIALHAHRLHPEDRDLLDGIAVTSVARTLLDLAEVLRPRQLRQAFEAAERLELFDLRRLESISERSSGRRGVKAFRAAVADQRPSVATRSELERRFLDLCRDAGLPRPAINVVVAGLEVDALWRDQRLIVELDGFEFHRSRAAFERDRSRDAALQLAGYRVLRFTHRRIELESGAVVATLASVLG